jgi:hypothetical protein
MTKPTDLFAYVERRHQDGGWRLVFFEDLWADQSLDIAQSPVLTPLGALGERYPTLFWHLAHIPSQSARMALSLARFSLSKDTTPTDPPANDPPLLLLHQPADIGDWIQDLTFRYPQTRWAWTTLPHLHSLLARPALPDLAQDWLENAQKALRLVDHPHLPPYTYGRHGLMGDVTQDDYLSAGHSSHDRLRATTDYAGLLPPGPETVRLVVGFDLDPASLEDPS